MSKKPQVGKLPPRYTFIMNPHQATRLSRCPKCEKLTYPRKFPLLIHVNDWGLCIMGKTCKYCSRCEFIMVHQDEIEPLLAQMFDQLKPEVVGNDYLVVGTVEMATWKAGLSNPQPIENVLKHARDFKKYLDLHFDPGGWRLPEDKRR